MKKVMGVSKRKGFTLLELLIVVAIIAILAAVALPRFVNATNKARTAAERAITRTLDTQIELYNITTGLFPSQASAATSMTDLLTSTSYFPDGVNAVKDPFTGGQGLGQYTMSLGTASDPIMRVDKYKHLYMCLGGKGAGNSGHDNAVCD